MSERPERGPSDSRDERTPSSTSRRGFLRLFAGTTAAGLALGAGFFNDALKRSAHERREHVKDMTAFLRGEASPLEGLSLTITDAENQKQEVLLTYDELVELFTDMARGHSVDSADQTEYVDSDYVKAALRGLAHMVQVEEDFGSSLNSNPLLEKIDQCLEQRLTQLSELAKDGKLNLPKTLPLASSFGFGQINARTARTIALRYHEHLLGEGLLTDSDVARLRERDIPEHEIVSILKLKGLHHENIIYSFLAFQEGLDVYGYDVNGNRIGDPDDGRLLSLAVTAHSARLRTPAVAKIQTYLNEIIYTDPVLKQSNALLEVDGDPGALTKKALIHVVTTLGIDIDPETIERASLQTLFDIAEKIKPIWNRRRNNLLGPEHHNAPKTPVQIEIMVELATRRYRSAIDVYLLVLEQCEKHNAHEAEALVTEQFLAFAKNRTMDFFTVLKNRIAFEHSYPQLPREAIDHIYRQLPRIISFAMDYDEQYRGYVPTAYSKQSMFRDDRNIFWRSLLAHEIKTRTSEEQPD